MDIPFEWILWNRCKKHNTLPLAGGELDQPDVLMLCFDIIDAELAIWQKELEKERLAKLEEEKEVREFNNKFQNPHVKLPAEFQQMIGR